MPILLSCLWKPKTLHEYSDFGYIRIYTYYLYYYYSFTQLSNNAQNIIARIFFCLHLAFFCGGKVGSNFFDKRSTINRSAWKKNLLLFSSRALKLKACTQRGRVKRALI